MITPAKKELLAKRSRTLAAIRDCFFRQGYIEVETPMAVRLPGQEPYLNPVPLTLHDDRGAPHQFYLHTSPEYAMKKLLAAGFEKIFQLGKCFRDRESFGGMHQPEFTLLEWYHAGIGYEELMDEVDALLAAASAPWGKTLARAERVTMNSLFKEYAGVNLDSWANIPIIEYEPRFFDLFLNKVEPHLPKHPLIIYEYPAQLGALARRSAHDPRYVERFELYIDGVEIANAFGELVDAGEQRRRFEEEQHIRAARGEAPFPIDEELLAALPAIPEPTSGIALGIDRLIMVLAGAPTIEDVVAFPFH